MLAILNSLNAHNLPIFQPIFMILVSKLMVHKALTDKTYLSLGLLYPLTTLTKIIRILSFNGSSPNSTMDIADLSLPLSLSLSLSLSLLQKMTKVDDAYMAYSLQCTQYQHNICRTCKNLPGLHVY